jgi:hypothetical protein
VIADQEIMNILFGMILLVIGAVVIAENQYFVDRMISSQKALDRALAKNQDYDSWVIRVVPKVIMIVIGTVFVVMGVAAVLFDPARH